MIESPIINFWNWQLPAALEKEYLDEITESTSRIIKRGTVWLSVAIWVIYFSAIHLGFDNVSNLTTIVGAQILFALGFATQLFRGRVRLFFNFITPLFPLGFVALYMKLYVVGLPPERAVQTQGIIIFVVLLFYILERLSPLNAVTSGVLTSIFFLWLRASTPQMESYSAQQIMAQLSLSNVAGAYLCFGQCRSLRLKFYLERALEAERISSEVLIRKVFPAKIADKLKGSDSGIAESYADVSVLFADLVGFTRLASEMPPSKLVPLLDDLFGRFDALADSAGVEKIKTIGDAYMAVAGCPVETADHALKIARFALGLSAVTAKFNGENGTQLKVRTGIHSGPVVAGVIGNKRISFDLWGDTVNIASRMESIAEPGDIVVSESSAELMRNHFVLSTPRSQEVKGKGLMKVYSLNSEFKT